MITLPKHIKQKEVRPDYNPDREGHVPKKWMVVKATRDPSFQGVTLDDGKSMKFGKKGAFMVNDPAKADEIRKEVGANATVTRFRTPTSHERIHRYFFGQWPEMPWKKKEGQDNEI